MLYIFELIKTLADLEQLRLL